MGDYRASEGLSDLVPRRLDLTPSPKKHLEQSRTQHQAFAVENPVHPKWRSYASQLHIYDVAVDPLHQSMWLATGGGVLCWDPKSQYCIRHTSAHGLAGNATRCIALDHAGFIWAGGQWGGLCSLESALDTGWQLQPNTRRWKVLQLATRPKDGVYVVLQAPDGEYALGEINAPGEDLHILWDSGLSVQAVDTLYVTDDDVLWLGNLWGLHRYGNGNTSSYKFADDGRTKIHASAIVQSPNSWFWIGTHRGLYRFEEGQEEPFSREEAWPRDAVISLAIEPDSGDLWCLTAREIGRLYNGVWQPTFQNPAGRLNKLLTVHQELKDTYPQSPVCPAEGQVWLASADGLYRVGLDSYEQAFGYTTEDMISNAIQTLWTDDTGVWVGAARGLYRFDGENWFDYAQDAPNLRDVRAIAPGQSPDQLWIGSWRMGLQRLQQGVYIPDEILTQPIVALADGVDGTTWAATIDTVYWQSQFNREWESIPHPIQNLIGGSVIQTMCHQLAPAPGGGIESTLWVGTSAGLFYYVPDREQWNEIKELSSLSVQALAVDPFTKRLWAGTSDGLFSEPAWECCHDGNVLALAFNHASDGNLWLGTNEGLEVWSSCGETGQFDGQPVNCFTAVDSGLAADRVTAISIRLVDDELEIWIGSPNGVSCYQPRPAEEKQR